MYASAAEIREDLGGPTEEQIPKSVIARAQRWAAAKIHSYLRNLYSSLPFQQPNIPDEVIEWEHDLAIYWISRTKWFDATSGINMEKVSEFHTKTLDDLKKAAKREIKLSVRMDERIHGQTLDFHPTMDTVRNQDDMGPDPDLIDELDEERSG